MPVPEGKITTSEIWNPSPEAVKEEANITFEKIEDEALTEEERLDIALKIHKGEL